MVATEVWFFQSPNVSYKYCAKPWLPWSPPLASWPQSSSSKLIPALALLNHHSVYSRMGWCWMEHVPTRGFKVSKQFNRNLQGFIVLQVYIDLIQPPNLCSCAVQNIKTLFRYMSPCFCLIVFECSDQCSLSVYFQLQRPFIPFFLISTVQQLYSPQLDTHSELLLCRVFEQFPRAGKHMFQFLGFLLSNTFPFT